MYIEELKVNGDILGTVLKEIMRRMILIINNERFDFTVQEKLGYSGELDDIHTSADDKSDYAAIRKLRKCFEDMFDIISEESGRFSKIYNLGKLVITIDSLDGTFAFNRRQSNGFGPMISVYYDGKIIAAYIGDAMTKEIYGYHPDSGSVHRISDFDKGVSLRDSHQKQLDGSWVQLRNNPYDLSPMARKMVGEKKENRLFAGLDVTSGSIGLSMARLWKGEVSAAILKSEVITPWDICPIIGICKKLDYVFMEINSHKKTITEIEIEPPLEITPFKKELIVIHRSNIPELQAWVKKHY